MHRNHFYETILNEKMTLTANGKWKSKSTQLSETCATQSDAKTVTGTQKYAPCVETRLKIINQQFDFSEMISEVEVGTLINALRVFNELVCNDNKNNRHLWQEK